MASRVDVTVAQSGIALVHVHANATFHSVPRRAHASEAVDAIQAHNALLTGRGRAFIYVGLTHGAVKSWRTVAHKCVAVVDASTSIFTGH